MFLERFMRYYPCFRQATHSLFDSDINLSIALLVVRFIFVYDLLGNDFDFYLVIFSLLHWIVQVEVLDIYNKVFSI